MNQAMWVGFGAFAAIAILAFVVITVWTRRGRRWLPTRVNGIRVEVLPVRCADDLILEREWRIPLLMTNVTNRPTVVPPLSARSAIRTGRKTFAAFTSLESDEIELNPGSELIGWVDVRLPAEEVPRRVIIDVLGSERRSGLELKANLGYAHIS